MGNCVFSDKPDSEQENQKLYKEILRELQERKKVASNYMKSKTKHNNKFSQSRTNKFFEDEPNTIQFKSLENTRDTFYTESIEGGFKKNLFYPNSSTTQFLNSNRRNSTHSRNNSRISVNKDSTMKFSLSSSSAFDGGRKITYSPCLRIDKENSHNSNFIVKKRLKKSKSVCLIKQQVTIM